MIALTIITPTYNRAHTLPYLYNSLLKQTFQNFLWLIIDDGSTDDTQTLIQKYINDNLINIRYLKKENGGKASALNMALDLVDTPYCMCQDSDDFFFPDAIEKGLSLLKEEEGNSECCGIMALRNTPDGNVMGGKHIPQSFKYATIVDIYYKANIRSEFVNIYKTEVAKLFRFPIIDGERFMPPSWFHYALSVDYKFRISHDRLVVCTYMEDGLTKNKRRIVVKNPQSYTLIKRISYSKSITFCQKIRNGIMYGVGCILSHDRNWLVNSPYRFLTFILAPFSYLVYLKLYRSIHKDAQTKD